MTIFFILVCVITLLPIINIVATSFSDKNAILTGKVGIWPVGFNTEAYSMILNDLSMIKAFFFSIALMIAQAVISMMATILAAYPLSKKDLPGKRVILLMIVFTMYFSAGMIPEYLIYKELHLLNTIWVLLLPGMISAFNLIILRTFFMSINQSLYEAAYIDGCSEFKALREIAIPLSKAALLTLTMFYAVNRWNGVSDIILYIQNPNLYTLQYKLKLMLDLINIPYEDGMVQIVAPENFKSACVVFTMLPMLIIYPFVQKYFKKGVMVGSVKE